MPYDPHRHRRRSIRLAGHDYTQPGAYFVTINTHAREPLLARIDAAGHAHTPLGAAVARSWAALPRHFPNIALDAWVLMPDHLHGIVVIHSWLPARAAEGPAGDRRPRGTAPGSLPAIIQSFKSTSARTANQIRRTPGAPLWQRGYYERILRDERALGLMRRYIERNPARWAARAPYR